MSVTRLEPDAFDWSSGSGGADEVRRIWEAATSADGRSPLDEAALLALRHHGLATGIILVSSRPSFGVEPPSVRGRAAPHSGSSRPPFGVEPPAVPDQLGGFAYVRGLSGAGRPELDVVVDPAARGHGVGTTLGRAVVELTDGIPVTAWSHGNHPAARALADRLGFRAVRELWLMRRDSSTPLPDVQTPAGVTIRAFHPGTADEEQFLAVNAAAFASHPEQGSLNHAGLAERMDEPWFDAEGFLVAERDGRLIGFHWTKVHPASGEKPAYGEVYVIGIDPSAQAGGLGRALLAAGLRHLHEGRLDLESRAARPRTEGGSTSNEGRLGEVVLYVEADNAPAIGLYEAFGFTHDARDTDVMYARP